MLGKRSRSGFTHTKTTKCELASLKQHILLNVFAHINLFPTSANGTRICIASPHHHISDLPISQLLSLLSPLSTLLYFL